MDGNLKEEESTKIPVLLKMEDDNDFFHEGPKYEPVNITAEQFESPANVVGENEKKERKTFKVKKSKVLDRVASFLPKMAEANQNLKKIIEKEGKDAPNMEKISSGQDSYIELDLACGILEGRQPNPDPIDVEKRTAEFLKNLGNSSHSSATKKVEEIE